MPPGEESVEVADGFVGTVVRLRADDHDAELAADRGLDLLRERGDLRVVLDRLGVPHAGLRQCVGGLPVRHEHTGHDQRPEKIPLAALVDARMRVFELQKRRRFRFVLRQPDQRFQHEFDEVLCPRALYDKLAGTVGCHLRFFACGLEEHVRAGGKLPRGNGFKTGPEGVHLVGSQSCDETSFTTHGDGSCVWDGMADNGGNGLFFKKIEKKHQNFSIIA